MGYGGYRQRTRVVQPLSADRVKSSLHSAHAWCLTKFVQLSQPDLASGITVLSAIVGTGKKKPVVAVFSCAKLLPNLRSQLGWKIGFSPHPSIASTTQPRGSGWIFICAYFESRDHHIRSTTNALIRSVATRVWLSLLLASCVLITSRAERNWPFCLQLANHSPRVDFLVAAHAASSDTRFAFSCGRMNNWSSVRSYG